MAPNVVSEGLTQTLDPRDVSKSKDKQEILYDGYFYDVTNFIGRHPGGNIIKFYTEQGEDATQAIEQFHYRARNRVAAIMKGFNKRKAEPHELGLEPKTISKNEMLSADFKKLFEELQEEGYFQPSYREVCLRLLECVALAFLSYGLLFKSETVLEKFFATAFVGFMAARHGWLEHEAGHRSLTGNPKIDNVIQKYCVSFIVGGSPAWWNSQHNRHHAMPQRLEHDVDLATLPFVAFHRRAVKNRKEINTFFVRYQAILYWTLDLLVATFAWKFSVNVRYQLRKKLYGEMLLNLFSYYLIYRLGIFWFAITIWWFAFSMALNFALSHSHLDVADKPTHWIEYSFTHTANITSNMFVDYWMGYLNYQIEHHLFPTMPQFRQKEITHRVKALAEKHGLPYRVLTYPDALYLALKNLNDVGKDLTN